MYSIDCINVGLIKMKQNFFVKATNHCNLSTRASSWCICLLECGKGLLLPCIVFFVRDLTSAVKLFGLRVTLTPSQKFSRYIFRIFCVRKNGIIGLRIFSLFQRTSRFNGMRFLACLYVDDCH